MLSMITKSQAEINAGIKSAFDTLIKLGDEMNLGFWDDELHQVNGYPIENRWNSLTLAQMEADIATAIGDISEDAAYGID
jgi:hypothetical protein